MTETMSPEVMMIELPKMLKRIIREKPELITADPAKHRHNLMIFGMSVLFEVKAKPGSLTPVPTEGRRLSTQPPEG